MGDIDISKDKAFLVNLLNDSSISEVWFWSAEQVHCRDPFNNWPFPYFKGDFENTQIFILKRRQ
jgi:hypothetical protein